MADPRPVEEGLQERVEAQIEEARTKAIDALSRYKFQMFGYWAAIWVHLNRLSPVPGGRPSPFREYVGMAKWQRQTLLSARRPREEG